MQQLAEEFVQNLAQHDSKVNKEITAGLRVEIVSCKNLAMPLETREVMQGLQASVLYRKEHVRSGTVLCESSDPVINFTKDFAVERRSVSNYFNFLFRSPQLTTNVNIISHIEMSKYYSIHKLIITFIIYFFPSSISILSLDHGRGQPDNGVPLCGTYQDYRSNSLWCTQLLSYFDLMCSY
jgi:hypothetical protein